MIVSYKKAIETKSDHCCFTFRFNSLKSVFPKGSCLFQIYIFPDRVRCVVEEKSILNTCDAMIERRLSLKVTHLDLNSTALIDGEVVINQQRFLSAINVDANADANPNHISENLNNINVETIFSTSGNPVAVSSINICDLTLDFLPFINRQWHKKVQLCTTRIATTNDTASAFTDEEDRCDCRARGTAASTSFVEIKSDRDSESWSGGGCGCSRDGEGESERRIKMEPKHPAKKMAKTVAAVVEAVSKEALAVSKR